MLDDFWRDVFTLVVAITTVAATVFSAIAISATKRQAARIATERRLAHQRDTLKAVLDIALRDGAENPGRFWKPGMAHLRTLTPETLERLSLTARYFSNRWESDLPLMAKARAESNAREHIARLGYWAWDLAQFGEDGTETSPARSILAVIYDELISEIQRVVAEE